MSATDELRKLLDERGVKWTSKPTHPETTWAYNGWWHNAKFEPWKPWSDSTFKVTLYDLTPEQAIAAMLGEDEKLLDLAHQAWDIAVCAMQDIPITARWGNAVEKGLREYGIDIDKLPYAVPDAVLDGKTCENIAQYPLVNFECSECGCTVEGGDELGANIEHGEWNHCPNCGNFVKRR